MINERPLISVTMSVFNEDKYLSEAIDSILSQTYQNFEFLIVNDGSSKSVRDLLNTYSDPRLVAIDQSWLGLTKSLNNAINNSKGVYIARMDADDISLPTRFQKQVEILDNNPNIGLVGTSYVEISEKGEEIYKTIFLADNQKLKQELLFQNQFCHGSVMFSRECLKKVGAYREEFKRAQDYDLWLRMSEYFDITNIQEILYKRRLDKDSISIAVKSEQNYFARLARQCARSRRKGKKEPLDKIRIIDKVGPHSRWFRSLDERRKLCQYDFHQGRLLFAQRKLKLARSFFLSSLKNLPLRFDSWGFLLATYLPISLVNKLEPIWKKLQKTVRLLCNPVKYTL